MLNIQVASCSLPQPTPAIAAIYQTPQEPAPRNVSQTIWAAYLAPLLDRFDLRVDVPPVAYSDLELPCDSELSADVAQRITAARRRQAERYA